MPIPPIMLPVSLVVELDCIAKTLADAFLNRVKINWDATRYAMRLPKKSSAPGTKTAKAAEESIRRQYPPLSSSATAEAARSGPRIVVDMDNVILVWYLPGILNDSRQSKITAATENLRPLLRSHQTGASSRANCENFHPGTDVPTGMITLSPAWFQQGHQETVQKTPQAAAIFQSEAAMNWLEDISESNAILSAILGVIHPHLYNAGRDTFNRLRQTAEIARQDVLQDWTSVFSGTSVIFNGNVRAHRDGQSRHHCSDDGNNSSGNGNDSSGNGNDSSGNGNDSSGNGNHLDDGNDGSNDGDDGSNDNDGDDGTDSGGPW
ncbi:hypothetical protein EDB84DRAFT_1559115 [Lactarius hengduanensis]|nr:hypothetical protein EDB84DRAFT_1559115 [Lactarius hengduanensis]